MSNKPYYNNLNKKNMKKILLFVMACLMLPRVAEAQTPTTDKFTVSDLEWDADNDCYVFTVSLDGSRIYTAYNLDIFLPTGINVKYDDGPVYWVDIAPNKDLYTINNRTGANSHSVSASMPNAHQLRVACISNTSTEFKATSGELFYVYVSVDADYFASCFSPKPIVKLSGMNLTTKAEEKYVPEDYACRPFTTGIPTERTLPVNVSSTNKVGTLILPFNADLPQGLTAYTCNATEGDLLTLTPAASIEACKPYIVFAKGGYSGSLVGTATLPDATNVTDVFADGYLTGVLTNTVVNTGYILQNQGKEGDPKFYDAEGAEFSLPAGRCYLTPSAGDARAFRFNFDESTGIDANNIEMVTDSRIFDLSGRLINSNSQLQRGIYIKGTRKMVIK